MKTELPEKYRTLCKEYNANRVNILGMLKQVATAKRPAPDLSSVGLVTESYCDPKELDVSENSLNKQFDIKYSFLLMIRISGIWHVGTLVKSAESAGLFRYKTSPKGKFTERWIRVYSNKIAPHQSYVKNPTALLYEKFRSYI